MSDAKKYRDANKAKARAMCEPTKGRVDASSFTPAEPLNAEFKTGLRPVSRQGFKSGGQVSGDVPALNGGRKPRKSGGNVANEIVNRNVKEANKAEFGSKHVGGMKKGGRTGKLGGGLVEQEEATSKVPKGRLNFGQNTVVPGQKRGGRAERASGGRTKGKTNINIVIQTGPKQPPGAPAMPPPPPGPPPGPPPMPPGPPPGMPPMGPPGMGGPPPGGPPPMGRQSGGRTNYKSMSAGAGSGLGRLQRSK